MLNVIGIHSNAIGDSSLVGSKFTEGHSWLTLHYTNGRHTSVGLWAESELLQLRHCIRDPIGISNKTEEKFEVLFGEEDRRHYRASASRYYGLREERTSKVVASIGELRGWRATYTCATWATEKIKEIFGISLASQELFGLTNTPRALGLALTRLNAIEPTSLEKPKYVK